MYAIIVFIILALVAITIIAKLLCFNKHIEDKKDNATPYKFNRDYYIRTFKFKDGSFITVWAFKTEAAFEFYKSVIDEGHFVYLLDTERTYRKIGKKWMLIEYNYLKDYFEHLKKVTK